jgi:hypothetical protein
MVTENVKEYERISDIIIENWIERGANLDWFESLI